MILKSFYVNYYVCFNYILKGVNKMARNADDYVGLNLEIEVYEEEDIVKMWIGDQNGSGAEYVVNSRQDIINNIEFYFKTYID